MLVIGIYINQSRAGLVIETPHPLQYELRNSQGKLIVTGNKLMQPTLTIDVQRLTQGDYTLKLHIQGQNVVKKITL